MESTRTEPMKIKNINELGEHLFLYNGVYVKEIDLNDIEALKQLKEFKDDYKIANKFPWLKEEGDLRILAEGQYVLIKKKTPLGSEWHYSIVNFLGRLCIHYGSSTLALDDCQEIYLVSAQEYFINTSKTFLESNPEYKNLINPDTNDYI